ncbi:hypothetical protein E1B28_012231 [Marasmius oreades]|uniref:F-box domain-containing protein n=1 Tax=Marasmius oreades TaxID=181124 RepID=A0A9P7RR51_9AGAR|nr:uncharacterized protein E1B28_012231 [Marasmius oreades]KAG7088214.1 hypothetical protein E1B28_012231 [Marasmius oreades]
MSALRPLLIDRLPHEILLIIFEIAVDVERPHETFLLKSGDDSKPIYYSPHVQETISHVCKEWRAVALRASSLWNTLHFNKVSDIHRAREYCQRVASSSYFDILILTVSEEDYNKSGRRRLWKDELEEIFSLLAPHTSRWRSFHLQVRDGRCKQVARKYIGTQVGKLCGPAPKLQTWQLYHFEDYRRQEDLREATFRQPVICFENEIPNLKHLSLIGVNLPWNSPYLQGLHSLELCLHPENIRPDYTDWHNMLTRSPELKSLFLHYSGPKFREVKWPSMPDIVLPQLEYLGFVDLEPDYLQAITATLQVTNVARLKLELGDADDETFFYNNWLKSISTPTPRFQSLTSLTITALQCDDPSLKLFLGTLPELTELELKHSVWLNVWRMFVDDLKWKEVTGPDGIVKGVSAGTGDDPLLLPKLGVLKVRGTRIDESSDCRCNVKLLLKFREREGPNPRPRHESPVPHSASDRPVFTIVGTLPVQVLPPAGAGTSDRNRQTNVLRRLVQADRLTDDRSQDAENDINLNWKVLVDIEDITDDDEDDVDDEDEEAYGSGEEDDDVDVDDDLLEEGDIEDED